MQLLSKSQYFKGRKCLKRIWLHNFRKDLIKETSTFQESLITQGNEVGELARQLYPRGILIHENYQDFVGALTHTKIAISNDASVLYESAFLFDNVAVRVDILLRNSDHTFDLIEVKSSTEIKEDEHFPDIAIQTYVLKHSGLYLRNIQLAILNKKYIKNGPLDLKELFNIYLVNDSLAEELQLVPDYLEDIKKTLSKDEEPFGEIGSICKKPYECEFKHYCWKNVSEKSIYHLSSITEKSRREFLSQGIEFVRDIPVKLVRNKQLIQVNSERSARPYINKDKIQKHMEQLQYPLYFLDFETMSFAIPRYNGTRPYQRLPFQYSLHVQDSPHSKLYHNEFLYELNDNPMRTLAEQLVHDIGQKGSIIVYNKSFEKGCLEKLAKEFLDLATMIGSMVDRLWDLMEPFSQKWYYDPGFNGSYSIKKVLPVLVPELTYDHLDIKQGNDALAKYLYFIDGPCSVEEREKIRNDLLFYCRLDTLAMVRILEALKNSI